MIFFNHYKTVVLSDVHLGTSDHFSTLTDFINSISCDVMIFTGDIINGWSKPQTEHLKKYYLQFVNTLRDISEKNNTKIIFTIKNETDIEGALDLTYGKFYFLNNYSFNSGGKLYHVLPGELSAFFNKKGFRPFSMEALRYNFLLWLNDRYNQYNFKKGRQYESLFKRFPSLKRDDDINYSFLSEYKHDLIKFSIDKDCEVIIGGHLHFPGIYHFGGISFLNPGYWSESLTALVETNGGLWKILEYDKVMEEKREAEHYMHIQDKFFNEHTTEKYVSKNY